ncbi:MAG: hypothetical protein JSS63_02090 [Bacteroidetes bacterium]|nr:hypothetical protein [Bacteroidota bacterium]
MISSQNQKILSKLDKKQTRKFRDFLASPYFNSRKVISHLFEIIVKHSPDFSSMPDDEAVFKVLYPGKTFSRQTIKNLYSELGNLLKKFTGYEEFSKDEKNLNRYIGDGLASLTLFDLSSKHINKCINENKNSLFSLDNLHYEKELYLVLHSNIGILDRNAADEHFITRKALSETLIMAFLKELYYLSMIDAIDKIFSHEKADTFTDKTLQAIDIKKILEYAGERKLSAAPLIKIQYYLYYYTVNDISEKEYIKLKAEFLSAIKLVTGFEKLHFILRMNQIIVTKLVPKNKEFYGEIFRFIKLLCSFNIFPLEVKVLGRGVYRDFFTTAVILKEYDWAENFVNEYGRFLPEDQRENEILLGKGILSFKKNNFDESLKYLNKLKITELTEKINVRYYYLMNYIELMAYESAYSSLSAIRQFCRDRKEIPDVVAGLVSDSLKYFLEIINCEEKGVKLEGIIYNEARGGRRYYHKQYILDKMKKLI